MPFSVRRLEDPDARAFAVLAAAIEADHPTNLQLSAEEFLEIRHLSGAVLEGAFDGDDLVAWSGYLAQAPRDDGRRIRVFGDVDPAYLGRGLGTLMAARALAGARTRHAADGAGLRATYVTSTVAGRTDQADLVAALGYRPERYRFTMVADLGGLDISPARHDGYDLVEFDPADSEVLRVAHQRAFSDYPVPMSMTADVWDTFMIQPRHTRHGLSSWLRDQESGEAASYLFSHEYAVPLSGNTDGRETYVPYLGTLPAHRGRGLASALMSHTLQASRDQGVARVSLEVDAHNPDGALGFYERAGFRTVASFEQCTLTEPPARSPI
ncbi:GNAT family N-acetyltransferase [Nocardioides sp. LHG3406-4]|uniref:GNAT family N-acetyltransferase n=1 Tax=Nocardioides sp. LHG3406-4 TaxID=2804575 RepID=UPI003CE87BC8